VIVVSGETEFDPEDVETAMEAAIEMMAETAKEPGCIHYRFYADIEVPSRLHVYEEWETEAALAAHMNTPHMATWRGVVGGLRVLSRNIKKFEAGPATRIA